MNNLNMFFDDDDQVKGGVVFFDLSQLMLASLMKTFKPEDDIDISMMRHMFLDTIRSNINRFKKDYPTAVLAVDSKDGYWRRDLAWYYKKSRKKKRDESSWDWDAIFGMINQLTEEFQKCLPSKVICVTKVEADDVIAILTKELSEKGHPIMIVSSDGDYVQLHTYKNVKQWSPMQKKLVKAKKSPYADLMVKLVKGDRKDCVAGIKARSSFYADKIDGERSPSISTKFLNELTDAADPRELLTGELLERFDENVQLLDFNAIPKKIVDEVINAYYNTQVGSRQRFYSYLVKNRCSVLLTKISEF